MFTARGLATNLPSITFPAKSRLAVVPTEVVDSESLLARFGVTKAPDRKEALVAHRWARLTPFGRLLLVTRVLEEGWSVAAAAESTADL